MKSIFESELALQILIEIADSENPSYPTRIAEDLERPQSSISRKLKIFNKLDFVEKGRRDKAQYYNLNPEEISKYWFDKLESELEKSDNREGLETIRDNREEIIQLHSLFISDILQQSEDIESNTLHNLIFKDFLCSLTTNAIYKEDFLQRKAYLEPMREAMLSFINAKDYPDIFEKSLEDL